MKKFIPILFLISGYAFADCVEEAMNISLMNKLNGSITNDIEEGRAACSSDTLEGDWEDSTNATYKRMKLIRGELKNKGKTSAEFFGFMSGSGGLVTEKDICNMVQREIDSMASECLPDKSFYQMMSKKSIVGMQLKDICSLMGPQIMVAAKGCKPGQIKDPPKEAPGNEISPAGESGSNLPGADEASKKFHKDLESHRKKNSNSGSGASKQ